MEAHLQKTIDDALEKLKAIEQQAAELKKFVNTVIKLDDPDAPPMFVIADDSPGLTTIKGDTFYGQAFATAVTVYLRMRKAQNLGPASVVEIFAALKKGGYQFDAKNDDYAKRGIRHSLGKNTATFHKVPNGEFGLTEWYPDVKKRPSKQAAAADDDDGDDDGDSDDDDDDDDTDEPEDNEPEQPPVAASPAPKVKIKLPVKLPTAKTNGAA